MKSRSRRVLTGGMNLQAFLANCVFLDLETTREGRLRQVGAGGRAGPASRMPALGPAGAGGAGCVCGSRGPRVSRAIMCCATTGKSSAPRPRSCDCFPCRSSIRCSCRRWRFPSIPTIIWSRTTSWSGTRSTTPSPMPGWPSSCSRTKCAELARRAARPRRRCLSLYRFCFADGVATERGPLPADGLVRVFEMLGARAIDDAGRPADLWPDRRRSSVSNGGRKRCLRDGPPSPAVAYCAAWLPVAGGNSVLPAWVRHQFPDVVRLLKAVARSAVRNVRPVRTAARSTIPRTAAEVLRVLRIPADSGGGGRLQPARGDRPPRNGRSSRYWRFCRPAAASRCASSCRRWCATSAAAC